jgi:FtsZ-binding cell division protein ZapB
LVESLECSTWKYDAQDGGDHRGPMAGRFHEQFELGPDDESIVSVDADGVAFAAIQGRAGRLAEKADRIDDLEAEVEDLADRQERLHNENDDLRADLAGVEAEKEALRERLAAVEERLSTLETGSETPAPAVD